MAQIEWVEVKRNSGDAPIGAIGFIGNKAVAVITFYDHRDLNRDGKVTSGENLLSSIFNLESSVLTEVAKQANAEPDIRMRDPTINLLAANLFTSFAKTLILEGVYTVYFARGVKILSAGIAKSVTSSAIQAFFIRKGFEASVKTAFNQVTTK